MHPLSPTRVGLDLSDTLRSVRERGARGPTEAVPTGFTALDLPLGGGVRRGELTVVAGRGGMGVTTFVLGLLRTAALQHGLAVLGIAPGQDPRDLHLRLVSAQARVALNHLRYGLTTDDDWRKIARCTDLFEAAPIWIETPSNASADDIVDAVESLQQSEADLALVVIDGLDNLHNPELLESRFLTVSRAVATLHSLARRLHIAVVLTCHLDRSPRPDRYPSLADLRDAGNLDAVADTILLLHRDDVYDRRSSRPGEADIIVGKNRGPTYDVNVHFQGQYARSVEPPP